MGCADLNQRHADEEQYDYPSGADDLVQAEPVVYPSSAGATVYVYFDGDRSRGAEAIERVIADYHGRHPATDFQPVVITRTDLQTQRYFAFPRTEQEFFQRGYAAEFDLRKGPAGRATTSYLSAQKSVLHVQSLLLSHVLENVGPNFFGWNDDFAGGGAPIAERGGFMQQRAIYNLAPMTGVESVGQGDNVTKYAMVDWRGLRLGRHISGRRDHAHLTFDGAPNSWIKSGRQAVHDGFFGWHQANRIAQQIDLELSERGLVAFFGAEHWHDHEAAVSAGAILTWHSQLIASLRKLVWRAEADEGHA